jgi:hypothetical protein
MITLSVITLCDFHCNLYFTVTMIVNTAYYDHTGESLLCQQKLLHLNGQKPWSSG